MKYQQHCDPPWFECGSKLIFSNGRKTLRVPSPMPSWTISLLGLGKTWLKVRKIYCTHTLFPLKLTYPVSNYPFSGSMSRSCKEDTLLDVLGPRCFSKFNMQTTKNRRYERLGWFDGVGLVLLKSWNSCEHVWGNSWESFLLNRLLQNQMQKLLVQERCS